ncbi:MAG: tRNA (adenosine(37)-N6)-threonylcarbamoyltransferase complex ATPase subunit type 1 TsaE [Planctomycetes bacterium]|nr:tRNA (adenosine(37)-N6)-threonylcarbamoyltransferase complex ATPase subunit type 1 TsaE [Planctomycetota bacterium]
MKRVHTKSPEETREFAAELARGLGAGAVLILVGDFGSGKTTFVQGLAAGLGVPELTAVCSPTFVMMNVYRGGRLPLFHMDATRFDDPREVFGLGWEEGEKGVTAVEWGEKVAGWIGRGHLRVEFQVVGETERQIRVIRGRKSFARKG